MCCRCYVEYLKDEELRMLYNLLNDKEDLKTSGEMFPTDNMMVVSKKKDNTIGVFKMKWGYEISNSKTRIFNARVETIKNKDIFIDGIKYRRCVIPVINYYEWHKNTKERFNIRNDSNVTYLLGIYRFENNMPVFTVITKEATGKMKNIHDRMPLIVDKEEIRKWIGNNSAVDEVINKTKNDLIARVEI